jgi:hypothetical protein
MPSSGTLLLRCVRRLLFTANVPIAPILAILMMEALRSSETSALTRATRHNIPDALPCLLLSFHGLVDVFLLWQFLFLAPITVSFQEFTQLAVH